MAEMVRMIPDLQASFACEDVRLEASGAHTIVGIVNFIGAPSLPIRAIKFCIWTRWCSGLGDFQQTTRLVGSDEETILAESVTEFQLTDDESHTTNVNFFSGIEFTQAGVHHVEILLEDELQLRYPIRVIIPQQVAEGS